MIQPLWRTVWRFPKKIIIELPYDPAITLLGLYREKTKTLNSKRYMRASLVAQWLRVCLPMQGTRVRALVWEDLTCRGATKPVRHNYWACALEPMSHNYWARVPQLLSLCSRAQGPQLLSLHSRAQEPQLLSLRSRACESQLLKPTCLEPRLHNKRSTTMISPCTAMKSRPRSPQPEKARVQQRRPNAAKNKINK